MFHLEILLHISKTMLISIVFEITLPCFLNYQNKLLKYKGKQLYLFK